MVSSWLVVVILIEGRKLKVVLEQYLLDEGGGGTATRWMRGRMLKLV